MRPTRRDVVTSIATATLGGIGIYTMTQDTQAQTNLEITEFNIPDADREITNPVNYARLNVNAQYAIQAGKQPTRVVLRLEGTRTGEYTQLVATELTALETDMSGTKELQGNLLDLPELEASELSPTETGETDTVELSIRLTMSVKRDGHLLSEHSVEDVVTINVTRGTASATIELGGSGSVALGEA